MLIGNSLVPAQQLHRRFSLPRQMRGFLARPRAKKKKSSRLLSGRSGARKDFFSTLNGNERLEMLAWMLADPAHVFTPEDVTDFFAAIHFNALIEIDACRRAEAFFNPDMFLSFEKEWQAYPGRRLFKTTDTFGDTHNLARRLMGEMSVNEGLALMQFIADRYVAHAGLRPVKVIVYDLDAESDRVGFWKNNTRELRLAPRYLTRDYRGGVKYLAHELEHAAHNHKAEKFGAGRSTDYRDGLYYLNSFFYFWPENNDRRYFAMPFEVAAYGAQAVAKDFMERTLHTPRYIAGAPQRIAALKRFRAQGLMKDGVTDAQLEDLAMDRPFRSALPASAPAATRPAPR